MTSTRHNSKKPRKRPTGALPIPRSRGWHAKRDGGGATPAPRHRRGYNAYGDMLYLQNEV